MIEKFNLNDINLDWKLQDYLSTKCGSYALYDTVNDKYYIGSTSSSYKRRLLSGKGAHILSILNPNHYGSQYCHIKFNMIGLNKTEFHILTPIFGVEEETRLIREYDSYENGYNLSPNGDFSNFDHVGVTNGIRDRLIARPKLEEFLSENPDYKIGCLSKSWAVGNSHTKGMIRLTNGVSNISIRLVDLDYFLQKNPDYYPGITKSSNGIRSKVWVSNESETIRINGSDLDEYSSLGYVRGRTKILPD